MVARRDYRRHESSLSRADVGSPQPRSAAMPARRRPFPCVRPSRLRTSAFDGRGRPDVLPSCPFDRRFGSGSLGLDWSGGADRRHSAVSWHHAHPANGAVPAVPVSRVPRADAEPAPGADEHPARRPDVAGGPLQADAPRREPAGGGAWLYHTELAGRPLRGRPAAHPRLPRHLARAGGDQCPLLRAVPGARRVDPGRVCVRDRPRRLAREGLLGLRVAHPELRDRHQLPRPQHRQVQHRQHRPS